MRDYDKEPLIIKSYSMFCGLCIVISMAIAFICSLYIFDPNFGNYKNDNNEYYKTSHSVISKKERESEARQKIASGVLNFVSSLGDMFSTFKCLFNFIGYMIVIFIYIRIIYNKTYEYIEDVKFINKYIELTKYNIKIDISKCDIARSLSSTADFGLYYTKTAILIMAIIFITLCFYGKAYFCIILITYMAILVPSQIFVNFLLYCIFNRSVKGFKIFLYIDLKDTTIFIYNYEVYKELKEYFLTTKNIDIDKVKKYYFIF